MHYSWVFIKIFRKTLFLTVSDNNHQLKNSVIVVVKLEEKHSKKFLL